MRPEALIDWTAADLSGTLRSMGLAPVKVFGRPGWKTLWLIDPSCAEIRQLVDSSSWRKWGHLLHRSCWAAAILCGYSGKWKHWCREAAVHSAFLKMLKNMSSKGRKQPYRRFESRRCSSQWAIRTSKRCSKSVVLPSSEQNHKPIRSVFIGRLYCCWN